MTMRCPHCHQPITPETTRCPHCFKSVLHRSPASQTGAAATLLTRALQWGHGEWHSMHMWLRNASPWPRWPLLVFMLYLAWNLSFAKGKEGFFWGINLGIHEAGHLLTTWAPKLICAAAGSALQCAVPLICMFIFRRQNDWPAIAFCLTWLGTNFNYVSWYMDDALEMRGQLVTVGHNPKPVPKEDIHDWHYIFRELGLLEASPFIADLVVLYGFVSLWAGVGLICYQLYCMHKKPTSA